MRSLTPEKTIQRLGWPAARRSLRKAISRTAPKPRKLRRWVPAAYREAYVKRLACWVRDWILWVARTVKLWFTVQKHAATHADYLALAKQGVESRETFRRTKRRMHLTEDEIFEQGNRILRGENLPPFQKYES